MSNVQFCTNFVWIARSKHNNFVNNHKLKKINCIIFSPLIQIIISNPGLNLSLCFLLVIHCRLLRVPVLMQSRLADKLYTNNSYIMSWHFVEIRLSQFDPPRREEPHFYNISFPQLFFTPVHKFCGPQKLCIRGIVG